MTTSYGKPYWWEAAEPEPTESGPPPAKVDVAIAGGGYAGLGAAIPLARAGRDVAVLERDRPGEGASTRNGGITSGNLRWSYARMKSAFGADAAKAFYREATEAREDLQRFIEAENIDCDFNLTGRFAGALCDKHLDAQKRAAELHHRELDIETIIVDAANQRNEIGSDYFKGGVIRPDMGGVHPGKLHKEMRRVAEEAGAKICGGTRVASIERNGAGFEVKTEKGVVRANHVIAATNGYTDEGLPWLRRRLVPVVSEIIATEPLDPDMMKRLMPKHQMFSESRHLAHYFRPSPDNSRILFGGRRYSGDFDQSREGLRQVMLKVFPELKDIGISHHWFGYVAFPMDQLPKFKEKDGIIYATGFCGSGVVWARWAGMKAANRILQRGDSATSFESRRFLPIPLYNGNPWFVPAMIAWYNVQDWMDGVRK